MRHCLRKTNEKSIILHRLILSEETRKVFSRFCRPFPNENNERSLGFLALNDAVVTESFIRFKKIIQYLHEKERYNGKLELKTSQESQQKAKLENR